MSRDSPTTPDVVYHASAGVLTLALLQSLTDHICPEAPLEVGAAWRCLQSASKLEPYQEAKTPTTRQWQHNFHAATSGAVEAAMKSLVASADSSRGYIARAKNAFQMGKCKLAMRLTGLHVEKENIVKLMKVLEHKGELVARRMVGEFYLKAETNEHLPIAYHFGPVSNSATAALRVQQIFVINRNLRTLKSLQLLSDCSRCIVYTNRQGALCLSLLALQHEMEMMLGPFTMQLCAMRLENSELTWPCEEQEVLHRLLAVVKGSTPSQSAWRYTSCIALLLHRVAHRKTRRRLDALKICDIQPPNAKQLAQLPGTLKAMLECMQAYHPDRVGECVESCCNVLLGGTNPTTPTTLPKQSTQEDPVSAFIAYLVEQANRKPLTDQSGSNFPIFHCEQLQPVHFSSEDALQNFLRAMYTPIVDREYLQEVLNGRIGHLDRVFQNRLRLMSPEQTTRLQSPPFAISAPGSPAEAYCPRDPKYATSGMQNFEDEMNTHGGDAYIGNPERLTQFQGQVQTNSHKAFNEVIEARHQGIDATTAPIVTIPSGKSAFTPNINLL